MTAPAVESLADQAYAALVLARALEEDARQTTEAARRAADAAVLAMADAGWTYRRIAAELEISSARVGQLVRRARDAAAAAFGEYTFTAGDARRQSLEDFRVARHAQDLREEEHTGGYAAERRSFYGHQNAPDADHVEQSLTWKHWLEQSRQEQPERKHAERA